MIKGAYGDKQTDTKAYQNSGISPASIYCVTDDKGCVKHRQKNLYWEPFISILGTLVNEETGASSSYKDQVEITDTLFPPL